MPIQNDRASSLVASIPVELKILDALDTFQKTAPEAPQEASFASSRNLKTEEQTSPSSAQTSLPEVGGRRIKLQKNKSGNQTPELGSGEKPLFSLSTRDISEEHLDLLDQNQEGSEGFDKRLKTGQDLKINAREFDYGNYLLRMKRKLRQHWNPTQTVQASMYQYDEIRVDIGVVLDHEGNILELRFLNHSLFGDFDKEALFAFERSKNFPNPPDSLVQDNNRVYMPWTFVLTMRNWGSNGGSYEID